MIAIIAGTGNLPIDAIKALINLNKQFIVISLFPENNLLKIKNILNNYNLGQVITLPFYKAGTILNILKKYNTQKLLFIGKVDKRNLFKNFKFDWLTVKALAMAATKSDTSLLQTIVNIVEQEGIKVLKQSDILKNLFVSPGILTGKLTPELQEDINFGLESANKLSLLDVGQTVVVKDKMIIAVEAIEGTDNCIARAIELGHKDLVICKTAHNNQNKKFDLPTLGPSTLENIKPGNVKAIAWHCDKTFISDLDIFIAKAKELNITLISV
ncbi:MAG: hypothetical protein SZ59_C0001G0030 [candidate division TM6 bacterium GW2011_GWF2_28_16]|nr:MAG: hypothetical protein SZ59_C0001G0030 [candidate division TM6 bacterium GW2011_GWF2_28_16]